MRPRSDQVHVTDATWAAFRADAAAVLAARERLDVDLDAVALRPFDRGGQDRLRSTLESEQLRSATDAAGRLADGASWD